MKIVTPQLQAFFLARLAFYEKNSAQMPIYEDYLNLRRMNQAKGVIQQRLVRHTKTGCALLVQQFAGFWL